jgi:murein DD-endopeptidase MepM/ murein hydrolase activator NlpD
MFVKARTLAVAVAAFAGLTAAHPALAASANADITGTLRAAEASKPATMGNGDEEFRRLFSSWSTLNRSVPAPFAGAIHSAIPSRIPVDGVALTSGFGMRWHPVLGGHRQHKGVDLASPIGTPIHAAADGVVGRADWFSSYGLYVALEHGGNIETRYGHMSRIAVAAGQQVHKGDVIGYIGTTGRSTGPHLHYEVRVNGAAVNPIPYMQGQTQFAAAANIALAR